MAPFHVVSVHCGGTASGAPSLRRDLGHRRRAGGASSTRAGGASSTRAGGASPTRAGGASSSGPSYLTSFPRRREPRSRLNAGVRAAGMSRAAARVICGECCPCGPVTWAPAFAGVTLVGGAPGLPHLTSCPRRTPRSALSLSKGGRTGRGSTGSPRRSVRAGRGTSSDVMPAQAGTQITSQRRCARRWNAARGCGGDLRGTWPARPGDLGPRLRGGDGCAWGTRECLAIAVKCEPISQH